jgi:hypothetical protein
MKASGSVSSGSDQKSRSDSVAPFRPKERGSVLKEYFNMVLLDIKVAGLQK